MFKTRAGEDFFFSFLDIEDDEDYLSELKTVIKNTLTASGEYHKTVDEQYETYKTKWYTD